MAEKDYVVVMNGKSKSYTEDQFNSPEMQNWLNSTEGVESYEVSPYDAKEEALDGDSFQLTNAQGQSKNYSRADFERPEMQNWIKANPDYKVSRVRPVMNEAQRQQKAHQDLVDDLAGRREQGEEWAELNDIQNQIVETRKALDNFDKKSSDELSSIPGARERVNKQAEQMKTRGQLLSSLRELEDKYYNHNLKIQQRVQGKQGAQIANENLDKLFAPYKEEAERQRSQRSPMLATVPYGGAYAQPTNEEVLYAAAKHLNNDTVRLYDAPSKYGKENGFDNYLKGAGDRASQVDFWTMGLTGIVDQYAIKGVLDKIRTELGGMKELTAENIDETLSPMEKEVLSAFLRNADAQADRAQDLSRGYQAGQGAMDSAMFMAQFILSGAITSGAVDILSSGAAKGLSEWISKVIGKEAKTAATTAVKQAVGRLSGDAAEAVVYSMLQPGTMKSILEAQNSLDKTGEIVDQRNAAFKGYLDYLVEVFSEHTGDYLGNVVGSLGGKKLVNALSQTEFGKWGKAFLSSDKVKALRAGQWHGFLGEVSEEFIGAALRDLSGLDPDAWEEQTKGENLAIMALSFLPMTLIGGTASTVKYAAARSDFKESDENLRNIMGTLGFDKEQIDHATDVTRLSSPEEIENTVKPILKEMRQRGASEEELRSVMDFAFNAARINVYDSFRETEAQEKRDAVQAELVGTYGDFWQGDEEKTVQRTTLPDGRSGYVKGANEEGEMIVLLDDGGTAFAKDTEVTTETMDQYLDSVILARKEQEDAEIVEEEAQDARQTFQQRIAERAPIEMGTPENPISGTLVTNMDPKLGEIPARDENGNYLVQTNAKDEDGIINTSFVPLSENDLARKWGIELNPKTQEELEADQLEAYRTAQARKDLYNVIPAGTEVQATLDGLDSPVKYSFVRAVYDEDSQAVQIYVEDMDTHEEVMLPESAIPGLEQLAAEQTQKAEQEAESEEVAEETAAEAAEAPEVLRDFKGNPIPLKEDGSVDKTAFWTRDPEAWAAWNDSQRNDGGADTIEYVSAAVKKAEGDLKKLNAAKSKELDFDKRDALEAKKKPLEDRIAALNNILTGYKNRQEKEKEQAKQVAAKPAEVIPSNITDEVREFFSALNKRGELRGKLNRADFKRELGWGEAETKPFFGWWAKKGQGRTLVSLAEELANDYDSQYGYIHSDGDQKDTQEARNAIIAVLNGASKPSEVFSIEAQEEYDPYKDDLFAEALMIQEAKEREEMEWIEKSAGSAVLAAVDQENYINFTSEYYNYYGQTESAGALESPQVGAEAVPGSESDDAGRILSVGEQPGEAAVSNADEGGVVPGAEPGGQDALAGGEQGAVEGPGADAQSTQEVVQGSLDFENETQAAVAAAEAEVDQNPTEAQKEAGNYKKGHVTIDGYDITIENPKGSVRSGVDASGREWSQTMNNTYGYIRMTEGVDGDHIDVFLSDNPEQGDVFVVDQVNKDGSFDEHKVMYGFHDEESARAAYLSNYEEGWTGLGNITGVTKDEFKKWVESSHRKTKPFAEYKSVNTINEGPQAPEREPARSERVAKITADIEKLGELDKDYDRLWKEWLSDNSIDNSAQRIDLSKQQSGLERSVKATLAWATEEELDEVGKIDSNRAKELVADERKRRGASKHHSRVSAIIAERQSVPKVKAKALGKLNLYNYTDHDEFRPVLNGVFHDDGFAVANDSHFLVAIKEGYDKKNNGKVIHKDGKEIAGTYPKWRSIIPNGETQKMDFSALRDFLAGVKEAQEKKYESLSDEEKKKSKKKEMVNRSKIILNVGNDLNIAFWNEELTKFADNAERIGAKELIFSDERHAVAAKTSKGVVLVMPIQIDWRDDKEEDEGYQADNLIAGGTYSFGKNEYQKSLETQPALTEAQKKSLAFIENKSTEEVTEEVRQQPLKDRIKAWEDRTGQKVEAIEKFDDVKDKTARAAILTGQKPSGWFDTKTGRVVIYLPNVTTESEIDQTYMHEIVSHKGLRELLGQERFNALMDSVWDDIMSEEDRKYWLDYNSHLTDLDEQGLRRAAADEYVANLAENVDSNPTAWERFVEKVKEILNKLGFDIKITDADLRTLLQASLANYERQQRELRAQAEAQQQAREDTQAFLDGKRTRDADTAAAQSAPQAVVSESQEKYEDFGEKIGWARKDLAKKGIKKGEGDSRPAWLKKYNTSNVEELEADAAAQARMLGLNTQFQEVTYDVTKGTDFNRPFVGYYIEKKKHYGREHSYKRFITDENRKPIIFKSLEQYEATVPVFEAMMQGYRVMKRGEKYVIGRPASNGKVVEYAEFPTKEDAVAYLATPEGCTELLNRKRENFELPALEELTRVGMPDYRNGRNITPDDFQKEFGFRGGEFGNWLNADERQQFLNYAYDALMDLANVIGTSPKALSLNGELSIAFGARGHQGAKAHYEPTKAVINLTKMNGAGSLAHEWAHALDNYFGIMDAKTVRNREKEVEENLHYLSEGPSWKRGAREEMRNAFGEVMDAIKTKTVTRTIEQGKADEEVEKYREWSNRELANYRKRLESGRKKYQYNRKTKTYDDVLYKLTPEQLEQFDQLIKELDTDKTFKWEYDFAKKGFRAHGEVGEKIYDLIKDVMPNRAEAYGPLNDFYYYYNRLQPKLLRQQEAREGKSETVKTATDVYNDSRWFDRGRASAYFSKDVELFARSFETYVSGELKSNNQSSDYLTYEKGPLYQKLWDHNPYPAGEERDAVKKAFDHFFDVIQEKSDEQTGRQVLFRKFKDEESQYLFDRAKEFFGTTNDLNEAGYILPDGSMLDFSGRHQVEGDSSFLRGRRSVDHRDIFDLAYEKDGWTETGIETDMADFINRGAIRIDSNAGAINLSIIPTEQQISKLSRLIEKNGGDVYVDFGAPDTDHYAEYSGAKASRVINDIKRYFEEGYKPEGNLMFRKEQEETPQFKAWFGDWKNDPKKASKVVDESGRPMIVYHQTRTWFTVFDPMHGGAGDSDYLTPFGIFLKPNDENIGLRGDVQMPLYANIRMPLTVGDRVELLDWLKNVVPGYDKLAGECKHVDIEYKAKFDKANKEDTDFMMNLRERRIAGEITKEEADRLLDEYFEKEQKAQPVLDEWREKAKEVSREAKELIGSHLRENGYDGVHIRDDRGSFGRRVETWIALEPNQVKSATGNTGAFSPENPDIRFRITPEQDKEYLEAVEKGDMEKAQEMVDEAAKAAGYTIRGYHGTTHNFTIFDRSKGNAEGDFGKGFYFTNSEADAEANYANEDGPDLTSRIEHLAENMEWMDGYEDLDYEERLEKAREMLAGDDPHIISAAIRMENPLILDSHPGSDETIFDFNNGYNEETGEYDEEASGLLIDFADAWRDVLDSWEYEGNRADVGEIIDYASGAPLSASQLEEKAREVAAYIENQSGEFASGEFLRAVFEKMGFDGIIDRNVNIKFGTQRKYGQSMAGMGNGVEHIIAFQPYQIKQVDPVTYDDNGKVIPLSQRFNPASDDIRFRKVTDPAKIEELENGEKETGYRTVVLNPDGTLGSPMAGRLGKKGAKSVKTSGFAFGEWEEAEENPGIATEDGKVNLIKPNGRGEVPSVDYNPYIHIRPNTINKQFTQAWKRQELVYIETQYPASELTSGYQAEKAKKPVGRHDWNGGELILSRYDKPVRVVPWGEVADEWAKEFKDGVTFDIVSPDLLPFLVDRGVKILPPKKAAGSAAMDAYNDWRGESLRFRKANENQAIFISNAENALGKIKMEKATPEQWVKMLEKEGGMKAGEDKWLGLSEWLRGLDRKTVTKDEVADFINQNKIQIEEQHYKEGGNVEELRSKYPGWDDAFEIEEDEFGGQSVVSIFVSDEEEAVDVYNAAHPDNQLSIEDGDLFDAAGEFISWDVITDWAKAEFDSTVMSKDGSTVRPIDGTRYQYTTIGLDNKHEIALTIPTIEPWKENDEVHFGDAGEGRAVAWVRFGDTIQDNDRSVAIQEAEEKKNRFLQQMFSKYNEAGLHLYEAMSKEERAEQEKIEKAVIDARFGGEKPKKVLFIDEIQSKRHQEAREKGGYKDDAALKKAEKRKAEAYDAYYGYAGKLIDKYGESNMRDMMTKEEDAEYQRLYSAYRDAENAVARNGFDPKDDEEYRRLKEEQYAFEHGGEFAQLMEDWKNAEGYEARMEINEKLKPYQERNREYFEAMDAREKELADEFDKNHKSTVPSAPFEKNWHELAMKRMLRYAAENGYDVVAWTTGEQQADRYSIGTKVKELEATESAFDGAYKDIYANQEHIAAIDKEGKIINGEYAGGTLSELVGKELAARLMAEGRVTLTGDSLRIGGEGMKGFYDDILPRFMNKYGKKWGVSVEDIELPQLEGAGIKAHSVKVTPEMKDSVMEGQLMFRKVTPEEDAEYMQAVENGDMDLAAKLVKEAADGAGYTIKAYHGGPYRFNVFDKGRLGLATGALSAKEGFFFAESSKVASGFVRDALENADYENIVDEIDRQIDDMPKEKIDNLFEEYKNGTLVPNAKVLYDDYLFDCEEAGKEPNDIEFIAGVLREDTYSDNEVQAKREFFKELVQHTGEGNYGDWEEFASFLRDKFGVNIGHVQGVYLKMTNPLVDNLPRDYYNDSVSIEDSMTNTILEAKQKGHDGVIFSRISERNLPHEAQYVVFEPDQIKSSDVVERDDDGNIIPLSKRFQDTSDDIRFRLSPEMDAAYEKAVNDGNDEKVRKMILDAAKAAMPNTKVVGKNGYPKVVYHGTPSEEAFNEFRDGMIFFTTDKGNANSYAHERRVLSVNPIQTGRVMPCFVNLENPLVVDANRRLWNNISVDWKEEPMTAGEIADYAKENGYDGVIIKRVRDNMFNDMQNYADDVIAFDSSQVKTTGAVYNREVRWHFPWDEHDELKKEFGPTFDKSGNLIPLSQRFNTNKEDIRFRKEESAPEELLAKVQEFGLRGVMDKEQVAEYYADALRLMPEETRNEVIDKAFGKDLNVRRQTKEYLASLALKGYAEDQSGLLRALANKIQESIPTDKLSENELLYMIWRDANRYSNMDLLSLAQDIALRRKLRVADYSGEKFPTEVKEAISRAETRIDQAEETREAERQAARKEVKKSPLSSITKAMMAQRGYDQETVNSIVALAKDMIKRGSLDSTTSREMARLLTIIKDAVGRKPAAAKESAKKLLDFMIDHELKTERELLDKMLKVKTATVKKPGVDVQAKLDIHTQGVINAFKENVKKSEAEIRTAISNLEDKMENASEARKEEIQSELEGLNLALQYATEIDANVKENEAIRQQIADAKKEFDELPEAEKKQFRSALNQEVEASYEKIRENRIERVNAFRELRAAVAEVLSEGTEKAKSFIERERARVNQIHHEANSDMQGVDDDPIEPKSSVMTRLTNNQVARFLTAPLATFDQMLRLLGRKHPNGQGYLWTRYMTQRRAADDNEKLGLDAANETLNAKVQEIFKDPTMTWNDLYHLERGMNKATIKFFNANGEWKEEELTQGNLLYIYMVDKMTDGQMKLRQMNITEENVREIKKALDPRFVKLADWMQGEFLPQLRDKYNEVHKRLFGTSMASIENYFPLRILGGVIKEEIDLSNPDSDALPSAMTGAIIKRTVNRKQLDITNSDAFSVMIEHVQEMEHWAAFAEFNKDLSTLLSYKRFQNQVKHLNTIYGSGKNLWGNFKKVAVLAAGEYRPARTPLDAAAVNLAKGVSTAKIAFRAYTAIKQVLSWPAFVADANIVELAKATSPTNWKENWDWAMQNLPNFKKRVEKRTVGNEKLEADELDAPIWSTGLAQWISKYGMSMNAFVDALTVSIGAKAMYETKYKQYASEGYAPRTAKKKAMFDAVTLFNETQQSSEKEFMSTMQADKTVVSVALSVYRNASFGYQRQVHQGLRTLSRVASKGYKEKSIEYMTKQLVRDGLSEADAKKAAEQRYENSITQAAVRVAVFGFLMQFAWNLGAHAIYLLFGNDPDEKNEMLAQDAKKALSGGMIEGLAGGSIMSDLLSKFENGESIYGYDMNTLPIMQDIKNTIAKFNTDPVAAANDLVFLGVQIGLGTNPQTFSDAILAIVDACNGDFGTAKEAMLCILRILQVPQSQLDELMIDEIGMTAGQARELTYEEVAQRYADYKVRRNAPITGALYSDELRSKREKAAKTTFKKKYNKRQE